MCFVWKGNGGDGDSDDDRAIVLYSPPHGLDPVSLTTDFVPSHGFDIEFSPVWLLLQQPDGIGSTTDSAGSSTHYICYGITCALLASLYIIRST